MEAWTLGLSYMKLLCLPPSPSLVRDNNQWVYVHQPGRFYTSFWAIVTTKFLVSPHERQQTVLEKQVHPFSFLITYNFILDLIRFFWFGNLQSESQLRLSPSCQHHQYLNVERVFWSRSVGCY